MAVGFLFGGDEGDRTPDLLNAMVKLAKKLLNIHGSKPHG